MHFTVMLALSYLLATASIRFNFQFHLEIKSLLKELFASTYDFQSYPLKQPTSRDHQVLLRDVGNIDIWLSYQKNVEIFKKMFSFHVCDPCQCLSAEVETVHDSTYV